MNAIIILALFLTLLPSCQSYRSINSFGMNKPHLLFQLGQRAKVSTNHGFAYWATLQNNKKNSFSNMRLQYQNKNNGLYVNMLSHDGDSHIHEQIQDTSLGVETQIRYQMLSDGWEEQIDMVRGKGEENTTSGYWLTYISVQNTDQNLVHQFKGITDTPIYLKLTEVGDYEATLTVQKATGDHQNIHVSSTTPLKTFGFSMNISQTYDVRNALQEVKYLIELQRFKMKKRKNDSDIVKWQNKQLKLMEQNQWIGNHYVFMVFYGEFTEETQIKVSNRTHKFQSEKFQKVSAELNEKYFPVEKYPEHSDFLKHILYNLYGGIAFYQGVLFTQNSLIRHEFDFSYSFTPSRLIFPRGFLWDDGFHLSVAVHYNPSIAIQVIHNWLRKIDLFGWIGREQIRGFQMGSLMPEAKFIYQDVFQMNPPTLILPILSLIEKSQSDDLDEETVQVLDTLLRQNFWKLEKWYRYFLKTQSHNNLMEKESINKTEKYRWRCKDDCERGNFMGSGLDDYPRVEKDSQISKQHVDLMSWIYFFSEGLEKIAGYLNKTKPAQYYHNKKLQIKQKIYEECLDPEDFIFKDQIVKGKNQFIDRLVSKIGYVSLFPFFTGVLREDQYDSSQWERVREVRKKLVSAMMDPDLLLSEDGIRSLSKADPDYGTLDNYWRGAVWMPINYLILRACKRFYWQDQEVRELYATLRLRLIQTVKSNWMEQGYLYENYHLGKGNRGFPFYGWTSLIVQIITEQY